MEREESTAPGADSPGRSSRAEPRSPGSTSSSGQIARRVERFSIANILTEGSSEVSESAMHDQPWETEARETAQAGDRDDGEHALAQRKAYDYYKGPPVRGGHHHHYQQGQDSASSTGYASQPQPSPVSGVGSSDMLQQQHWRRRSSIAGSDAPASYHPYAGHQYQARRERTASSGEEAQYYHQLHQNDVHGVAFHDALGPPLTRRVSGAHDVGLSPADNHGHYFAMADRGRVTAVGHHSSSHNSFAWSFSAPGTPSPTPPDADTHGGSFHHGRHPGTGFPAQATGSFDNDYGPEPAAPRQRQNVHRVRHYSWQHDSASDAASPPVATSHVHRASLLHGHRDVHHHPMDSPAYHDEQPPPRPRPQYYDAAYPHHHRDTVARDLPYMLPGSGMMGAEYAQNFTSRQDMGHHHGQRYSAPHASAMPSAQRRLWRGDSRRLSCPPGAMMMGMQGDPAEIQHLQHRAPGTSRGQGPRPIRSGPMPPGGQPPGASNAWDNIYRHQGNFRPGVSYQTMIMQALESQGGRPKTLKEIYTWIEDSYAYYRKQANGGASWRSTVRHTLVTQENNFVKVQIPRRSDGKMISCWTTTALAAQARDGSGGRPPPLQHESAQQQQPAPDQATPMNTGDSSGIGSSSSPANAPPSAGLSETSL